MRLIVEVHPREKAEIDHLIAEGRYTTPEQLIEVSIRNQLLLESESRTPHAAATARDAVKHANRPPIAIPAGVSAGGLANYLKQPTIGSDFRPNLEAAPRSDLILPHFATKLLPCKIVVRFLLWRLGDAGEDDLPVSELQAPLQAIAAQLRSQLVEAHKINPRLRGTFLHAGFPDYDAKSIQRFHDLYFIGHPSSGGPSTSLSVRLGLVAVRVDARTGEPWVGLTAEGAAFAALPNPLLDSSTIKSDASGLSDEEALTLARLIKERSPRDYSLLQSIVESLSTTPVPREDLVRKLRVPLQKVGAKTDAVTNGIFVAAMSRLVEIGAALIVKDGLRTKYLAGPRSRLISEGAGL